MIYIAFDPGKTGGVCVLDSEPMEVKVNRPMPVVVIKTKGRQAREYDPSGIRQVVAEHSRCEPSAVIAVIEGQQGRPGQRLGGCEETVEYAFGLLKGICVGLGVQTRTVYPVTWQRVMYAGLVEDCPGCGLRIDPDHRIVRSREVVRTRGKHVGKKAVEIGRFCPECSTPVDGKLRSVRSVEVNYPFAVDLRATPASKTHHDGMADALCIALWAAKTQLR